MINLILILILIWSKNAKIKQKIKITYINSMVIENITAIDKNCGLKKYILN